MERYGMYQKLMFRQLAEVAEAIESFKEQNNDFMTFMIIKSLSKNFRQPHAEEMATIYNFYHQLGKNKPTQHRAKFLPANSELPKKYRGFFYELMVTGIIDLKIEGGKFTKVLANNKSIPIDVFSKILNLKLDETNRTQIKSTLEPLGIELETLDLF